MPDDIITKAKKIRLLLLDIDGILTDGTIYYGEDNRQYKGFNIQDGLGLQLLHRAGIETGVISGKCADYLFAHLTQLNMKYIYLGHENKLQVYKTICQQTKLTAEQIAYMGDDFLDLPVLSRVGLSITVANSHLQVRDYVDWITKCDGGKGAVREVCDLLLQAQGHMQSMLNFYLQSTESI